MQYSLTSLCSCEDCSSERRDCEWNAGKDGAVSSLTRNLPFSYVHVGLVADGSAPDPGTRFSKVPITFWAEKCYFLKFFFFFYRLALIFSSNLPLYCMLNSLSPNSDQHQISPCYINAYLTPEVMRIEDMIAQGEFSQ